MATPSHIALLRGVNVGGVRVEMAALRALAKGLGWRDVQSYIASGNLLFSAQGANDALADALRLALRDATGADVPILVLTGPQLAAALEAHPFAPDKGSLSHILLCWDTPRIDSGHYETLRVPDEDLRIAGGHVHLLAPSGLARSKLAARIGQVVQETEVTARNLNTIRKLVTLTTPA